MIYIYCEIMELVDDIGNPDLEIQIVLINESFVWMAEYFKISDCSALYQ